MKYHGKKWLYAFLRDKGYAIPKLKDFYYAKWRGDEWIKSCWGEFFVMCYNGTAISISETAIDEETGDRVCELTNTMYRLRDGEWVKTYHHDYIKKTVWYEATGNTNHY